MEEDIRLRKRLIEIKKGQEAIEENKKLHQKEEDKKLEDSLDKLRKEAAQKKKLEKSERSGTAYSS